MADTQMLGCSLDIVGTTRNRKIIVKWTPIRLAPVCAREIHGRDDLLHEEAAVYQDFTGRTTEKVVPWKGPLVRDRT